MFRQILTGAQQTVLELLSPIAEVRTDLVPQDLLTVLRGAGELAVLQEAAGTLTVRLRGVATSFFHCAFGRSSVVSPPIRTICSAA